MSANVRDRYFCNCNLSVGQGWTNPGSQCDPADPPAPSRRPEAFGSGIPQLEPPQPLPSTPRLCLCVLRDLCGENSSIRPLTQPSDLRLSASSADSPVPGPPFSVCTLPQVESPRPVQSAISLTPCLIRVKSVFHPWLHAYFFTATS
jgi:hypothetical protein